MLFVHLFTYVLRFVRSPSFISIEIHIKAVKAEDMVVALAGAPMAKSRAAVEDSDKKKSKARSKASRGAEILKKVGVSKVVKLLTYFKEKIGRGWGHLGRLFLWLLILVFYRPAANNRGQGDLDHGGCSSLPRALHLWP